MADVTKPTECIHSVGFSDFPAGDACGRKIRREKKSSPAGKLAFADFCPPGAHVAGAD